ncbi:hypothetical protein GCM10023324_43260 [Streptomyces youssoufiensis]
MAPVAPGAFRACPPGLVTPGGRGLVAGYGHARRVRARAPGTGTRAGYGARPPGTGTRARSAGPVSRLLFSGAAADGDDAKEGRGGISRVWGGRPSAGGS